MEIVKTNYSHGFKLGPKPNGTAGLGPMAGPCKRAHTPGVVTNCGSGRSAHRGMVAGGSPTGET
jgi:hypothetical protein